jgi:ferrous iron transport protein B
LLKAIYEVATGSYICKPHRIKNISTELNVAVEKLSEKIIEEFPNLQNVRWVALRLLEGDQSIIEAIRSGELENIKPGIAEPVKQEPLLE